MRSFFTIALSTIFFIGLSSFQLSENVQKSNWVHLGSKKVNWGLEKDVIEVGKTEGSFTKLKIKVRGGDVNMRKMMVTYGNGNTENIAVKFHFKKGAESRVIDLKGEKRKIKKITFWYDTKNSSKRKATVHVAGKKA